MAITKVFSGFGWTWSSFPLEGILYLYKSCQIDKVRESCLVWIPKSFIWLRIEPNTPAWIDVGESPSLSGGSCSGADKDELLPGGCYPIWIKIGFKDRDFCNWIWPYVSRLTRSQSKLDDGSVLTVPKVTTRRTSVRGWIGICHDLRRVRRWPL